MFIAYSDDGSNLFILNDVTRIGSKNHPRPTDAHQIRALPITSFLMHRCGQKHGQFPGTSEATLLY
jgi:hypothetical protein